VKKKIIPNSTFSILINTYKKIIDLNNSMREASSTISLEVEASCKKGGV
jgi:hypothetical protein